MKNHSKRQTRIATLATLALLMTWSVASLGDVANAESSSVARTPESQIASVPLGEAARSVEVVPATTVETPELVATAETPEASGYAAFRGALRGAGTPPL
ncbi:hypothetical protein [Boudabousia marimammalium]|uniref:Secreted protein n=1 Tax=Boudabousia marimammalium TaxID=156892 RepID=A0A1Q5PKE5_9ACTO|nr:hypothetical protein [Boudabousia marimammalium]OKL46693.1 hypothetical protein BM477_06990 [Boudabousia marimammalium]